MPNWIGFLAFFSTQATQALRNHGSSVSSLDETDVLRPARDDPTHSLPPSSARHWVPVALPTTSALPARAGDNKLDDDLSALSTNPTQGAYDPEQNNFYYCSQDFSVGTKPDFLENILRYRIDILPPSLTTSIQAHQQTKC